MKKTDQKLKMTKIDSKLKISKIDQISRITKLSHYVTEHYPKMMTTLFGGNFQSAISCGVTKNLVKSIILQRDFGDSIEFNTDDKLNPKNSRIYVISVLKELYESNKDHVFVIYIDSMGLTYLFQSNCYTNQSFLSFYQNANKYLGKAQNSFEFDLKKIINKINNQTFHNVEALMRILTANDFDLDEKEKQKMKNKKLIEIHKLALRSDYNEYAWLENTIFYKKMIDALDD